MLYHKSTYFIFTYLPTNPPTSTLNIIREIGKSHLGIVHG